MVVKICKFDQNETVAVLPEGAHVLGRGPTLQCNDKRVSRNHALLKIDENNITLTSTHINPSFIRLANSKTITILKNNSSTDLHDGDAFAFLPEDFWFKLKIDQDIKFENVQELFSSAAKRCLDSSEDEPPDKKTKIEDNNETVEAPIPANDESSIECSNMEESSEAKPLDEEIDISYNTVKEEQENNETPKIKTEEPEDGASTSTANAAGPKSRREKCWYGGQCYRKNTEHRSDYAHPGDSDYESDPNDDRPTCSYGAACYRTNKDHRTQWKHPSGKPQAKPKEKRTRKKVKAPGKADSAEVDDFIDDDSDPDPYATDGDTDDDYEQNSDDDSDWEASQDVNKDGDDEDGENFKQLVKEAKRFVKKS